MAKLSESKMEEIRDAVSIFDRVGDGKIAVQDIVRLLRALDLNPGSEDWDNEINDYIKSNVERIDVTEFASIYAEEEAKQKATLKDLVEGLKAVDPQNGEVGTVGRAALVRYMTNIGDCMTLQEAETILNSCQSDQDGKIININDLLKTVMND